MFMYLFIYLIWSGGGTEVSLEDESPAAKLEPEQIQEPKEEMSKEIKEPEPATVSAGGDEVVATKKVGHLWICTCFKYLEMYGSRVDC